MQCYTNGRSSVEQRPARWRITDLSVSSAAPINIDWLAPVEVRLEQIMFHWSAAPIAVEDLVLQRDSVDGAQYDVVYRREDPSIAGWTDWTCVETFRFAQGDHVLVTYPNTNNNTVGVTLFLVQVDN